MSKSYSIIFGLTADPIHLGHEQAIINAAQYLHRCNMEIKEFLLVPVYQPNLIADKKAPIAPYDHRVQMCDLVAKRLSKKLSCIIKVSQIEKHIAQHTGKNNYSLNTIKQLNLDNCLFMVSADHFGGRWPKFRKWFKWQEILQQSGLLINQRPGHNLNQGFIQELKQINSAIYIVDCTLTIDTSSSEIRAGIRNIDLSHHLDGDINQYLTRYTLY